MRPRYRPARPDDTAACIALRGRTRENAIPTERLAALGITEAAWRGEVESGRLTGHVALDPDADALVGYAFGDTVTGEVKVLAMLPAWEGRGIGATLLGRLVDTLRQRGHPRLFLGCSADPAHRSHGFYRHLGWRPTGERDGLGDEVLELLT